MLTTTRLDHNEKKTMTALLSKDELLAAAAKLAGNRVMIIGDAMLDHYVTGEVERISPEAPVPVVHVSSETHRLGGAGNVARNITALGGAPTLFSVRGPDTVGETMSAMLKDHGVDARLVTDPQRITSRKTRIMAQNQQIVRIDRETPEPVTGQALDQLLDAADAAMDEHHVIILSDYGKGVVSDAFMRRLLALVDARTPRPLVLVDPKTVNYPLYPGVDLLTPNAKEASEGAGIPAKGRDGVIRAGLALFKRLKCRHLLVTLGADGMALFESPERVRHIPTLARKVFDVTGAGDTVIATLALGLAAGQDLATAAVLANYAAGLAVAQVGAATVAPEELAEALASLDAPDVEDWLG